MKKVVLFLMVLSSVFVVSGCGKKQNDIEIYSKNLTNYTMQIEYNNTEKSVKATQVVDYINTSQTILNQVKFHLYPQFFEEGNTEFVVPMNKVNTAYPNGLSYADFNIERVLVEGHDVLPKYEGECDGILSVDLINNLLPSGRVKIEIDFNIILPNCCHRFGYGNNTVNLANFYPIVCVFEDGDFCVEPYNSNGDPFYSEMANYQVELVTDKPMQVAGTGNKTETEKGYNFSARLVRDFALVLSEKFEVVAETVNNTTIEYYYFDDENFSQSLKAGVDAIKTFSKLFGTYPYKTFSIVKADFVYGGMEFPNLIMISADIDNLDDYLNVIIHETAHQWWYGMVGNNEFEYPWLDEALTEYSTFLFYDENTDYNLTHKEMLEMDRSNYSLFVSVYTEVLGTLDTSMRPVDEYSTEPEYTYCTYVKGVLMYESLMGLIGKKDFVAGLKLYFVNNKYTNTAPHDLIYCFEQTSGKNLSNFFASWQSGKVIIK